MNRIQVVADALEALTYAEMMELATSLADMATDRTFDCTNAVHWASLLGSFAEEYGEEE